MNDDFSWCDLAKSNVSPICSDDLIGISEQWLHVRVDFAVRTEQFDVCKLPKIPEFNKFIIHGFQCHRWYLHLTLERVNSFDHSLMKLSSQQFILIRSDIVILLDAGKVLHHKNVHSSFVCFANQVAEFTSVLWLFIVTFLFFVIILETLRPEFGPNRQTDDRWFSLGEWKSWNQNPLWCVWEIVLGLTA